MTKDIKARAEKELLHRFIQWLPRIFFVTVTTVAVVVATQLYKAPKVNFVNVYYEAGKLNYEIHIDPLDSTIDEDSLNIILSAPNERHEQKGIIGYQTNTFDVVVNRTYRLRVEGDVGLGQQLLAEKRITIKDRPYVNLRSFSQVNDTLEIYFTVENTASIIGDKVTVQVLSQLNSIYYETIEYANGVSLVIPNIVPDVSYTLRVIGHIPDKTKLFEQTILSSSMPQVNAHVESMQGMVHYMININDFYKRLSGSVDVELHHKGLIEKNTYPVEETREYFGEFMLREHPQGVYTVKVYGLVGYKRTLLYEQSLYNVPMALLQHTIEETKVSGKVVMEDDYKINDYQLILEVTDQATNEVTKHRIDASLTYAFDIDLTKNYTLQLQLIWNYKTHNIVYDFIAATSMSATVTLNQIENFIDFNVSIANPNNDPINSIVIKAIHEDGLVVENTYQTTLISDQMSLDEFGLYTFEVVVNGEVIKTQRFYFPPPFELIAKEENNALVVETFMSHAMTRPTAIDLYLNNAFVERKNGSNATFTNLSPDGIYEIRFVIIADEEFVVKTIQHLYSPTGLTAIIDTTVESSTVLFNITLANPDNITVDRLIVELTDGIAQPQRLELTTDYSGSFNVSLGGQYTLFVYHGDDQIGFKSVIIPPSVSLDLIANNYAINAYMISDDPINTGVISTRLYMNNALVDSVMNREAMFTNLSDNTVYEVRIVWSYGDIEDVLASDSVLFKPALEQEEIRIITADFTYDSTQSGYVLEVVYEDTMTSVNAYNLILKHNGSDVLTHEFVMDGTKLSIPVTEVYDYGLVVISPIGDVQELAAYELTNRLPYAVIRNVSYSNQVLNYAVHFHGHATNYQQKTLVLRHTLNNVSTNYMMDYTTVYTSSLNSENGDIKLEVILDGVVIGALDYFAPPTGRLDLVDDGSTLTITPTIDQPTDKPVFAQVYQDQSLVAEQQYTGDALIFTSLQADTPFNIVLVVRADKDYQIYTIDYVVSTFFIETIYSDNTISVYFNPDYGLEGITRYDYVITYDDQTTASGSIDVASLQGNTLEISTTHPFTSATIVLRAQTTDGIKLLGQRTINI